MKNQARTRVLERRKFFLSESFEENQGKEDPFLNHPFWATFNSPMTEQRFPKLLTLYQY